MKRLNIDVKKRDSWSQLITPRFLKVTIFFLFILIIIIAYEPIRHNDFLSYDDHTYVIENQNVRSGLNLRSLRWAFISFHGANWHPLTWISHMIDCELFGVNPLGHHLVNLLIHLMNSLLLLWILKKITGKQWLSLFTAVLFAIHPIHVESVAWIAERKDVLSTFFGLLTIVAYYFYTRSSNVKNYLLVIVLFTLGLLAKPMLVTMPFILLLLDYWPLERFQWYDSNSKSPKNIFNLSQFLRLVYEKVPLFILSLGSSIVTFIAQKSGGAILALERIPLKLRMTNSVVSYLHYIYKIIYPENLAIFYPHPEENLSIFKALICFIILIAISIFVFNMGKRKKFLIVGWFWYLITLIPVIGIIQVGIQAMADRYTYIPSIGIFIVFVWGLDELIRNWRNKKLVYGVLLSFVLLSFTLLSRMQVRYFKNDFTVFQHAVDVTAKNDIMSANLCVTYNNYGDTFFDRKMYDKALFYFKKALKINPYNIKASINICKVLLFTNKIDQAITCYHKILKFRKDDAQVYQNLGYAYALQGNDSMAYKYLEEALAIKPDYPLALFDLAELQKKQGKYDEAIKQFQILLKGKPDIPEAYIGKFFYLRGSIKLVQLYEQKGEIAKAIEAAEETVRLADFLKNKKVSLKMKKQIQLYKKKLNPK